MCANPKRLVVPNRIKFETFRVAKNLHHEYVDDHKQVQCSQVLRIQVFMKTRMGERVTARTYVMATHTIRYRLGHCRPTRARKRVAQQC